MPSDQRVFRAALLETVSRSLYDMPFGSQRSRRFWRASDHFQMWELNAAARREQRNRELQRAAATRIEFARGGVMRRHGCGGRITAHSIAKG